MNPVTCTVPRNPHTVQPEPIFTPAKIDDILPQWQTAFLIDRQAMRCTPRTIEFYRYTLGHLLDFLQAQGGGAASLTPPNLRAWLVDMQSRQWADTTIHMHARAAKTFCRWLLAESLILSNPWDRVSMPRVAQKILPAFTVPEIKRLLAVARSERDKALVLVLLDSGCRAEEFCALTLGDLDLRTGALMVRQGKGRKDRVTRLGAKTRKQLLRYMRSRPGMKPTDPLFITQNGRPFSPNSLLQALRRLGETADVAHCAPHAFRRTFAIMSYRQGMSLMNLQLMLGHSDISVLRRYLDIQAPDIEAAHQRYGPVDNLL